MQSSDREKQLSCDAIQAFLEIPAVKEQLERSSLSEKFTF